MNFCLNLFNLYFMFSFFSSRFLLKVFPQIFKHILPSDDFCWTIIIFKLILVKIILGCTWDSLYFMYILIMTFNQICGYIMFLRCCHRCFNVGYWRRMIYIYLKKKKNSQIGYNLQKVGVLLYKKNFFICRWIIEGGCYNAEFVSWSKARRRNGGHWQNTEFIYTEILNKTFLALMFTSDIFYIFISFIIKSSIYAIFRYVTGYLFYFCSCQDIYF